jgi:hypothetical protein
LGGIVNKVETFKLRNGDSQVVLSPLSDFHWKVLGGTDGFQAGDEVCGARLISFQKAKERVNADRTRLSPWKLVLLKGGNEAKSNREVLEFLIRRPWEPDPTPPAAA